MSDTVLINEFSTGINVVRTEGGWLSGGFTLGYMNSTMTEIPQTVERAIANKLFAVAEGQGSARPAVIGRVVPGTTGWSVVAIMSRARDNTQDSRPVSLYRYFLTEGADNLWKILTWIELVRAKKRQLPIFNPLEKRNPGKPIQYKLQESALLVTVSADIQSSLNSQTTPILIQANRVQNIQTINAWAKAKAGNQPYSWAYNVQALEKPWKFTLIHPANQSAYQNIQDAVSRGPSARTPESFDEQGLKSAIKDLMQYPSVEMNNQSVATVAAALANDQVTKEYWHQVFNAEGANRAITYNVSSKAMACLLTLRAIVIPDTLVKLFCWLQEKSNRQFQGLAMELANDFDRQFPPNQLPILNERLVWGIEKLMLEDLLAKKITLKAIEQLLITNNNPWKPFISLFIQNVKQDLTRIGNCNGVINKQYLKYSDFWSDIIQYWPDFESNPLVYYQPLAELFEILEEYELSIDFYQVSKGIVPKKIWRLLFPLQDKKARLFGLPVVRQVTPDEIFIEFVAEYGKIGFLIISPLMLLGMCMFMGYKWAEWDNTSAEVTIGKAARNFNLINDIKDIIEAIQAENPDYTEEDITNQIIAKLCTGESCSKEYKYLSSPNPEYISIKSEWSRKIYKYQEEKKITADGTLNEETIKKLKQSIIKDDDNDIDPTPTPSGKSCRVLETTVTDLDTKFKTTRKTIQQLIERIVKTNRLNEKQIRESIQESLCAEFRLNFAVIDNDNKAQSQDSQWKAEKEKWIEAIYNYQKKNTVLGTPDGTMDETGNTVKFLEVDIYKFNQTRKAIIALIKEVGGQDKNRKDRVIRLLKETLGPDLSYGGGVIVGDFNRNALNDFFNHQLNWIEAIYQYEEKKNKEQGKFVQNRDGIIKKNGETYRLLEEEIKEKLK